MVIKVAINGYGRIGRSILKALYESPKTAQIKIVAINEKNDLETAAYLTQYDTAHGYFNAKVTTGKNKLCINDDEILYLQESNIEKLPWQMLGVDIVFECTGLFRSKLLAGKHISAGAKKVLISAPSDGPVDATVVYGVNEHILKANDRIISNASCTTNCLAPVIKPLLETVGVQHGLMTSIHAFTNNQVLSDSLNADIQRARSATMNQVPTSTGAAKAMGLVIPELANKLDGMAMRVPTINVSVVDLVISTTRPTTVEEINHIIKEASQANPTVLGYNQQPLVSGDFNHCPQSSVFDAGLTQVIDGTMVKVFAWYDNEWGFSNRMLDMAIVMMACKRQ